MPLTYANLVTSTTKKNGFVVLRFNNSGGVSTQGCLLNSSATYQGANAIGDTLKDMYLSYISYSLAPSANAVIRRGGNIVFTAYGGQEGEYDLGAQQLRLEKGGEAVANVRVTFTGAGTVIMRLKKNSTSQTALE
jgi:hypothetical protein